MNASLLLSYLIWSNKENFLNESHVFIFLIKSMDWECIVQYSSKGWLNEVF